MIREEGPQSGSERAIVSGEAINGARMDYEEVADEPSLVLAMAVIEDLGDLEGDLLLHEIDGIDEDRALVIRDMLKQFRSMSSATSWSRDQLAPLLGCSEPDPRLWATVDIGRLQRSLDVLRVIADFVDEVASGDHLYLLKGQTAADRRRGASREALNLAIDAIARLRGSGGVARQILSEADASSRIQEDMLGVARQETLRLISGERERLRKLGAAVADIPFVDPVQNDVVTSFDEAQTRFLAS